jgi:glycosyltransferase involved in cell wall biosynthesis
MNVRRRVLFILPTLQGGGAERVICTLLNHLDRDRFTPSLVVLDMAGAVYHQDLPADVRVHNLGGLRLRHALVPLVRLIWRERPDIVVATSGHINLSLAALRPLLPRRTCVIARETGMISQLGSEGYEPVPQWWHWAYRRFFGALDLVICQSEEMQQDLVDNLRVPAGKTIVLGNPVDIDSVRKRSAAPLPSGWPPCPRAINLVAVGSLQPRKGFDILIDALALTNRSDLRVTILGEGPERTALQSRTALHGLIDQVQFLGFQRNPYPYIARADAFVLSSRFEGMPNVVLEALVCRTPVVGVPTPGGVRDVLRDLPGCALASEVTASALASILTTFTFGQRLSAGIADHFAAGPIAQKYGDALLGAWHRRSFRV